MTTDARRIEEKKAARRRAFSAGVASLAIHAVVFATLGIFSTPTPAAVGTDMISVDLSASVGGNSAAGGKGHSAPASTDTAEPKRGPPTPSSMTGAPRSEIESDRIVEWATPVGVSDQSPILQGGEGAFTAEGSIGGEEREAGQGGGGQSSPAGVLDLAGEAKAIGARIVAEVEARKTYPEGARRRGTQGVVRLHLSVASDGALGQARVEESSGSPLLDKAALELVEKVFPVGNPSRRELDFTISVNYSLSPATGN